MRCPTLNELPPPPPDRIGWPWTEETAPLPDTRPDNSTWPRVSIVTPSYNQSPFIEETIRSVLLQGYPNLEYIVVDGGSTDGSVDIIRKYEQHLAYWGSEPDQGQVDAINKGFARSTGEILNWLNSDDVYVHSSAIQQVISLFQQYPGADAVSGAGVIMSHDGHWVRGTEVMPRYAYYAQLRYRNCILQPATFFKRRILDMVPLDTTLHFAFDWDFYVRLTRDYNLLMVNEVWAGYRMWGENKTGTGSAARAREQAEVVRRYVGARSWQYGLLRLFALFYGGVGKMPAALQPPLRSLVRDISRVTSLLSSRRIPIA